jgi:DNA invertase Pin-like site-specific DNA recombinase
VTFFTCRASASKPLILGRLAALAEFERDLIRERILG